MIMSDDKQKENEERIVKSIAVLQSVSDSNVTPRNIRRIVKESMVMLQDNTLSQGVRAANAISMLDDISQDPNMPSYARVTIGMQFLHLKV